MFSYRASAVCNLVDLILIKGLEPLDSCSSVSLHIHTGHPSHCARCYAWNLLVFSYQASAVSNLVDLKRTGSCPGPLVASAYIYIRAIPHTVHAAMEPTGVQLSGKCCEQPCGPKKDRIMSRTLGSISLHIHTGHPSHCARCYGTYWCSAIRQVL